MPDSYQVHGHHSRARAGQASQPTAAPPPTESTPIIDPDQTRDRAMEAFLAAVSNINNNPGQPSNLVLAREAVDAIAKHTIALASEKPKPASPGDIIDDDRR